MEILCAVMAWYIVGMASMMYIYAGEYHDGIPASDRPLYDVLAMCILALTGPFCLCWAIHSAWNRTAPKAK